MLTVDKEMMDIDEEWLKLILEAKELGLSIQSIQAFLNQKEQQA
ncbi:DNA-binding anti-repressor SinI [Neobacillus sp. OS1-2]|nr:DNA-binding anti-repressor SinI [Neobacillus sp. OS1-2]WML41358.1 DNA-binding anti-repressor SinI [Neobacillus sp. OS1-2]